MKTIIITTKDSGNCYQKIRDNWFEDCSYMTIHTDTNIVGPELQPEYNTICIKEKDGYRVCLPSCIKPIISQDKKVNYILSLMCLLIKELKASKSDVYLVIHSGDLFDLKDARRITGNVQFSWLNCNTDILIQLQGMVDEKHIYQFRHDCNDISDLLLDPEEEDYLWFCKSLIEIIEE